MKYLKNDDEIRILNTQEDLEEYLTFRKKHDEWLQVYINELSAIGIPNIPLFIPKFCTDIKVKKNGYTMDVPDIDWNELENEECIEDTGLFLAFPYHDQIKNFPTRRIAFATICKRCDDDCGVMYRFDTKPNKGVLPIDEKASRLTRDFQLCSDNCKILYRDKKISAVLSKEYAVLPADEVIHALIEELLKEHPNLTFDHGTVSHEYLMAEFLLNDKEMEETFRLRLNDAGADVSTLKAGVRFATSDVGMSRVSATVFYDADGIRTTLDGGVYLEHKGDATPEKFASQCENFGMIFQECEELIEQLGNIDIMNVAMVVKSIQEVYSFLPKNITDVVVQELELKYATGGTGIDVYLALNDIVQRHAEQTALSPTRYLNLCEQTAKLMKLPYEKIDAGEEWKKI